MRRRILVVSFRPIPVPPVAGFALRILETARYLARDHDVDLLYTCRPGAPADLALRREGVFRRLFRFVYQPWHFGANILRALPSRLPVQVHAYTFSGVSRWLADRQHDYEAIVGNYVRVAEMLRDLSVPTLLDLHDAVSLHYERAAALTTGPRRLALRAEARRLLRYEVACVRHFPRSLVVSEVDRDYLIGHGAPAERLLAVPVAIPRDLLVRPPYEGPEDQDLVFLGRMAYAPNRDAALHFARDTLPLVRAGAPDTRLAVVGADPPADVLALAAREGITVTGTVPDPADWLERAKVVVAPVRYGAGMQNKVLQALALRRAVVMHPFCAASLGGEPGEHYLVASEPREFARAVLCCLRDPGLRARLGEAGRRLVERRFAWDSVGARIAAEIGMLAPLARSA